MTTYLIQLDTLAQEMHQKISANRATDADVQRFRRNGFSKSTKRDSGRQSVQ